MNKYTIMQALKDVSEIVLITWFSLIFVFVTVVLPLVIFANLVSGMK